jgi:hypothetical protein
MIRFVLIFLFFFFQIPLLTFLPFSYGRLKEEQFYLYLCIFYQSLIYGVNCIRTPMFQEGVVCRPNRKIFYIPGIVKPIITVIS